MSDEVLFLMQCRPAVQTLVKVFAEKMRSAAITTLEDVKRQEESEEKEESVLAMLGIIGTVLNLFVIIFVYIYTTL
ncbi:protein TUNAR-like isoform X1 [Pituophis catenifer annectens]|uniref:protein TUNAR-like isoform X1 n=1 Tax=Pituophis catenifer annectens TaxID=94852 RepID=UPI00399151A0